MQKESKKIYYACKELHLYVRLSFQNLQDWKDWKILKIWSDTVSTQSAVSTQSVVSTQSAFKLEKVGSLSMK